MTSWLSSGRARAFLLPLFLVLLAAGIFRLPYHFPVPPSVSVSYVFQFSNRAAVIIFLVGITLFAILFRGLGLRPARKDSQVPFYWAAVVSVLCVGVAAMYWWISSLHGLEGESIYFYDRLAQLATGKVIYRQFEFAYGPLLLYLPFWTGKLLHLDLIRGYIVCWMAFWFIGVWLLYVIVNAVDIPSPYRTILFLIFAVDQAQSLWPEGLNYTPVRGVLAAAVAVLVYRSYHKGYSLNLVAAASVAGAALVSAISPEHGIAFMLGTGAFFVLVARKRADRPWLFFGIVAAGFLLIVGIGAYKGMYMTLRAFASGGYNYPLIPLPGVLCVLALFLLAACVGYSTIQRGQIDSLTIYLLCICVFSLPSGFGRCDSGHLQLGAFSALIIAALALGRYRTVSIIAALAFLYWPATAQYHSDFSAVREQLEYRLLYPGIRPERVYVAIRQVSHLLHIDAHLQTMEQKQAQRARFEGPTPVVPDTGVINAPLGLTRNGYAITDGRVDYGYFAGLENVILPSQIPIITDWLDSHPERPIQLPAKWQGICEVFGEAKAPAFQTIYGLHWATPRRSEGVLEPLCSYILRNYTPESENETGAWSIWRRNGQHSVTELNLQ
jgi:hypothetical protein